MKKVRETLEAMCSIYDKKMTPQAIVLLMADLSKYTEGELLEALRRCRGELKFFPSIAEIKERIPDGHPSPNEAWAKLPKTEEESTVWTEEMSGAYNVAHSLIMSGDMVAARMAFLEKYKELVAESRANNQRATYSLSLGYDREGRADTIKKAVELKAISPERARAISQPEISDEGMKIAGIAKIESLDKV